MYVLKSLPYSYNALEPYISTRTVTIHHEKHHKGYLDKLNIALNKANFDFSHSILWVIQNIDNFPLSLRGDILYNAGGVLNHDLYFEILSSNKNNEPKGILKDEINKEFGSFEKFREEFIKNALSVVGSGWTFLVLNKDKKLQIINTSNQETPYLYGFTPIIGLDLWEHSYYLDYQNNKNQYIDNFFLLLDFDRIENLYEETYQK